MSEPIRLITQELDGKRIAYSSETVFRVQLGKVGHAYRDRYHFTGNLTQAVLYFNGLNVAAPYQKRLYSESMRHPVLARVVGC